MNIFKKLRAVDYVIIVILVAAVVFGGLFYSKKANMSNLPVEEEVKIYFDVFFRGITVTSTDVPFKPGDDAFITIRNIPYTKLKITDMLGRPRMMVIPANNKEGYTVVEDISVPNAYDFLVRFEDTAKKTPDGYVAGGNKIKSGLPVVIEGFKYRYSGTVSNVLEVSEAQAQMQQMQQMQQTKAE